jgi:hypothetical protein
MAPNEATESQKVANKRAGVLEAGMQALGGKRLWSKKLCEYQECVEGSDQRLAK